MFQLNLLPGGIRFQMCQSLGNYYLLCSALVELWRLLRLTLLVPPLHGKHMGIVRSVKKTDFTYPTIGVVNPMGLD